MYIYTQYILFTLTQIPLPYNMTMLALSKARMTLFHGAYLSMLLFNKFAFPYLFRIKLDPVGPSTEPHLWGKFRG